MAGSPIKRERGIRKLREIGLDEVLERVAEGKLYRQIAEEFDVSLSSVSEFLYLPENNTGDNIGRVSAARKMGSRSHIETALTDAEAEQDPRMAGLQKLRADMRLHIARSDDPETWGEKKNLQVTGQLDVQAMHLLAVSRKTRVLPGRAVPLEAAGSLPQLAGAVESVVTEAEIEEADDGEGTEAGLAELLG